MNAEKLKVIAIAEGMGYEVQPLTNRWNELMVTMKGRGTIPFSYNPLTNAEQCMEIMEKLKINVIWKGKELETCSAWVLIYIGMTGGIEGKGKPISEAVCNAAYEYFKE